jgi:hypothetical protein
MVFALPLHLISISHDLSCLVLLQLVMSCRIVHIFILAMAIFKNANAESIWKPALCLRQSEAPPVRLCNFPDGRRMIPCKIGGFRRIFFSR